MDSRQNRVAQNEVLFREVNERIEDITREMGDPLRADFLCECGDEDCTEPINLTLDEYEAVRAVPTRFVIVPGHDMPDVEQVVERNERFAVVEKHGGQAEKLAIEHDPRKGRR